MLRGVTTIPQNLADPGGGQRRDLVHQLFLNSQQGRYSAAGDHGIFVPMRIGVLHDHREAPGRRSKSL